MGLPRATPIHDFSRIIHGPAVGTAWVSHEPFMRHPFNSRERRPKVSMLYTHKGKITCISAMSRRVATSYTKKESVFTPPAFMRVELSVPLALRNGISFNPLL